MVTFIVEMCFRSQSLRSAGKSILGGGNSMRKGIVVLTLVVCVGESLRFPLRVQCRGVVGTLDSMSESLKCQVKKFGLDLTGNKQPLTAAIQSRHRILRLQPGVGGEGMFKRKSLL